MCRSSAPTTRPPTEPGCATTCTSRTLAAAHLRALDYLRAAGRSVTLNVGYGHGYSVREVLAMVEAVGGKPLVIREEPRRAGDPAYLVARAERIRAELGWQPRLRRSARHCFQLPRVGAQAAAREPWAGDARQLYLICPKPLRFEPSFLLLNQNITHANYHFRLRLRGPGDGRLPGRCRQPRRVRRCRRAQGRDAQGAARSRSTSPASTRWSSAMPRRGDLRFTTDAAGGRRARPVSADRGRHPARRGWLGGPAPCARGRAHHRRAHEPSTRS